MLRRRLRLRLLFGVLCACVVPHSGHGQVTTVEGASVIVFPRIIVDGTWDTVIQISNTASRPAYAHCFYVNGALTDPGLPPGPANPPLWTQTDFAIVLPQRQQPTHWVVSTGRLDNPNDVACRFAGQAKPCDPQTSGTDHADCCDSGYDPGNVPPVVSGFTGELRCIEEDASGAPWSGNALVGFATLTHLASGEVVKYPAIGLPGYETNDADGTLCLGGASRDGCAHGAEYGSCPQTWVLSHPSDYDERAVDGDARATAITVVPCGENFVTQTPSPQTLQFRVTNEFEQSFSAATTITCWASLRLSDVNAVFQRASQGGEWAQTQVRAPPGTPGGFLVVQQSEHDTAEPATSAFAGMVPAHIGVDADGAAIVLPTEVLQ